MKTLLVIVFALFLSLSSVFAQKVRIMGIGDSITEGGGTFSSYMGPLKTMINESGLDCEFVGIREGKSCGVSYRHSAFGGKNTEFIDSKIDSIFSVCQADIVLIHSGHNHFIEEKPVDGIVLSHKSIIEKLRKRNPNVKILVAGVIDSGKLPKYSYIRDLNIRLKALVDEYADDNIIFVNVGDGFDWRIHTINDKVHPNSVGAYVMASNWYKALNIILLKN
jgi:acetyl esterase